MSRVFHLLSGTTYEVLAASQEEAEQKWDLYLEGKVCICKDPDCECVVEGEATTAWETQ